MALDTVTISALVLGSGILTREVVEEIKKLVPKLQGFYILPLSIAVNTLLAAAWAYWQHYELNVATTGAILSFVVSVYYQEWKRNQKTIESQLPSFPTD